MKYNEGKQHSFKKEFLSFLPTNPHATMSRQCLSCSSFRRIPFAKIIDALARSSFPLAAVRERDYLLFSRVARKKRRRRKTEKKESISARKKTEDERCLCCVCVFSVKIVRRGKKPSRKLGFSASAFLMDTHTCWGGKKRSRSSL